MRKIRRNILKNLLKSNRIRGAWRGMQVKKYGELLWQMMYRKCVGVI